MEQDNGGAVSVSTPAFQTHMCRETCSHKHTHAPFHLFTTAPELIVQHISLVWESQLQRQKRKKQAKARFKSLQSVVLCSISLFISIHSALIYPNMQLKVLLITNCWYFTTAGVCDRNKMARYRTLLPIDRKLLVEWGSKFLATELEHLAWGLLGQKNDNLLLSCSSLCLICAVYGPTLAYLIFKISKEMLNLKK